MDNNQRLHGIRTAVAIGAILASISGAHSEQGEDRQVLVCMERTSDPSLVISRAKILTTQMFDQIGVALVWRGLKHCPEKPRPIIIRLTDDSPRRLFPGALAVSYPFEGVHIRVFYDRVRTVTLSCPLDVLLAHVLAHEIGHILQSTDRHSASGVMKGYWDLSDYRRMARQPFPFSDLDIQLIRLGLDARADPLFAKRLSELTSSKRPTF